jgi:hypothetical protein
MSLPSALKSGPAVKRSADPTDVANRRVGFDGAHQPLVVGAEVGGADVAASELAESGERGTGLPVDVEHTDGRFEPTADRGEGAVLRDGASAPDSLDAPDGDEGVGVERRHVGFTRFQVHRECGRSGGAE